MNDLSLIEEWVLMGLADARTEAGRTASELLTDEWRRAIAEPKTETAAALRRLAESKLIEELPRAPRQRSGRWRIREEGRKWLDEALGDMSMRGRVWKQKAGRAAAARRALGLTSRVAAALVDGSALATYFLAARLGDSYRPGLTPETLARRAAAGALGLSNDQPETLWRAVLERAGGNRTAPSVEAEPARREDGASQSPRVVGDNKASFAREVQEASRASREGWFGANKIFIHRVWQTWQSMTHDRNGLPAFKARLLEALRAGEIALTRADFPASLDPDDLEAAETNYGNEVFHFITAQRAE